MPSPKRRSLASGAAWVAAIAALAGCGDATSSGEPPGSEPPVTGGEQRLRLLEVQPPEGDGLGGETVTLVGTGFQAGAAVFFGDRPAATATVANGFSIIVTTPPSAAPGLVDVRLFSGAQERVLEGGFRYVARLSVQSATPGWISAEGGTPVVVSGSGFDDATSVVVGGRSVSDLEFVSSRELRVVTPPCFPGSVNLAVVSRGGRALLEDAFICHEPLEIDDYTPTAGPAGGGTRVTLRGSGFASPARLWLGEGEASELSVVDNNRLEASLPSCTPGMHRLRLEMPTGEIELPVPFQCVAPVRIVDVQPVRLSSLGGDRVRIDGERFPDEIEVEIGGRSAPLVDRGANGQFLEVLAPPGAVGDTTLSIVHPAGRVVWSGPLRYRAQTALVEADPPTLPLHLGGEVQLIGRDLEAVRGVRVDGVEVRSFHRLNSRRIVIDVSPGSRVGLVPVHIDTHEGETLRFSNLLSFFAEDAPRLAGIAPPRGRSGDVVRAIGPGIDEAEHFDIGGTTVAPQRRGPGWSQLQLPAALTPGQHFVEAIARNGVAFPGRVAFELLEEVVLLRADPPSGDVAGGYALSLHGSGLQPGDALQFGWLPPVNGSPGPEGGLEFEVPPGVVGPITLRLHRDGVAVPGATLLWRYTGEVDVVALEPPMGSVAGGTFVEVIGRGFTSDLRVRLAGAEVSNLQVLGPNRLSLRTPPGIAGLSPLTLESPGGTYVSEDAFLYRDPYLRRGGAAGAPIAEAAAINVSVRDARSGARIEDAVVTVGHMPGPTELAHTNAAGQAVLSWAGIEGPVDLTVSADGYAAFTLVELDSADVGVFLTPKIFPPSGGPGESVRTLIRGNVYGLDPKFIPFPSEGERVVVKLMSTTRGRGGLNPPPGDGALLTAEGPYELNTRPGEQAVIALAGLERDGAFTAYVMGVRHFIFLRPGDTLEDQDVYLDTPLDQRLTVDVSEAPWSSPGVDRVSFSAWIRLGFEGWLPQSFSSFAEGDLGLIHRMPRLGGSLSAADEPTVLVVAQASTDGGLPVAIRLADTVASYDTPVEVGPFIGLPTVSAPADEGTVVDERFAFDMVFGAEQPSYARIYLDDVDNMPVWEILMPGHRASIQLPDLRRLGEPDPVPRGGAFTQLIIPALVDDFDYSNFALTELYSSHWRSYAIGRSIFIWE